MSLEWMGLFEEIEQDEQLKQCIAILTSLQFQYQSLKCTEKADKIKKAIADLVE